MNKNKQQKGRSTIISKNNQWEGHSTVTRAGLVFPVESIRNKIKKYQLTHDFEEKEKKNIGVVRFHELQRGWEIKWNERDYKESVKKSKVLWNKSYSAHKTIKKNFPRLVEELWIAREVLKNQGTRTGKSFKGYLNEIGIPVPTAYRWLKMTKDADIETTPTENKSQEDSEREQKNEKEIERILSLNQKKKALSTLLRDNPYDKNYSVKHYGNKFTLILSNEKFMNDFRRLVNKYIMLLEQ